MDTPELVKTWLRNINSSTIVTEFKKDLLDQLPKELDHIHSRYGNLSREDCEFKVTWCEENTYYGLYHLSFDLRVAGVSALRITWSHYPACCAMDMMNDFWHSRVASEELIHWLLDRIQLVTSYANFKDRRWVFNFVEIAESPSSLIQNWTQDVVPNEDPHMQFAKIYNWATKFPDKRKSRVHRMINHNTGRIIHFTEVMFL